VPHDQITTTCHYVSRFLTKPWEVEQRKLFFYDFETDCFVRGQSATLFAGNQLNSQQVETWLDRVVENPLGRCRRRFASARVRENPPAAR
jgi:hypothetical protein